MNFEMWIRGILGVPQTGAVLQRSTDRVLEMYGSFVVVLPLTPQESTVAVLTTLPSSPKMVVQVEIKASETGGKVTEAVTAIVAPDIELWGEQYFGSAQLTKPHQELVKVYVSQLIADASPE